jgi:hypothetical protein
MADPNDGWETEEDEDENDFSDDSGDEHWEETDEEYAARQVRVAARHEREAAARRPLTTARNARRYTEAPPARAERRETREERYARRNSEAVSSAASSSAASADTSVSSSAASSSTPVPAEERMRRATESRERGRADAIAEREERERADAIAEREERERTRGTAEEPRSTDAPNPLITKFEAIDKAKRNAPGIKLTSPEIYEGRKFSKRLNKITKQFGNNPHVVFEMETVAENYKIVTLAINYLNREMDLLKVKSKTTKEENRAWSNMAEWIHQLQVERVYLKDSLDRMVRDNRAKWSQPFVPVPITVPDIEKDCLGETESGISKAPLVQGKCVKLSDGRCYNFDDIIAYYKKTPDKVNLISPYTRGAFEKADIDIILTLIQQGHSGGKKTKRNKKKQTKRTKPKMRRTRVR